MPTDDKKMMFAIPVFGDRYIGMLISILFSIKKSNPDALTSVFYQDIQEKFVDSIKKSFSGTEFIKTQFDFKRNHASRVSSKVIFWNYILEYFKDDRIVFVDVDMLVIKPLSYFFAKSDFDVLITTKINENAPINNGIILVNNSQKVRTFFKQLAKNTTNILMSSELTKKATDSRYPYGASDQMALYQMIQFEIDKKHYDIKINGEYIKLKTEECRILNETNSTKISVHTHVIHYKGGWQKILIDGENFTNKRPKKDSWEMYIYYLKNYRDALIYLSQYTNADFSFFIRKPFYLNKDFKERERERESYYMTFILSGKVLLNFQVA